MKPRAMNQDQPRINKPLTPAHRVDIDKLTVRAHVRAAEKVRARRMDNRAIDVIRFARLEVEREYLESLMREGK